MKQSALNLAEAIRLLLDRHDRLSMNSGGLHPDLLQAACVAEGVAIECSSFGFAKSGFNGDDPIAYDATVRLAKTFLAIQRFKDRWEPVDWRDDLEQHLIKLEVAIGITTVPRGIVSNRSGYSKSGRSAWLN